MDIDAIKPKVGETWEFELWPGHWRECRILAMVERPQGPLFTFQYRSLVGKLKEITTCPLSYRRSE